MFTPGWSPAWFIPFANESRPFQWWVLYFRQHDQAMAILVAPSVAEFSDLEVFTPGQAYLFLVVQRDITVSIERHGTGIRQMTCK